MRFFRLNNNHKTDEWQRLMASERQQLLQYACYRLGNREDAEDAVQDLFTKIIQQSPTTSSTELPDDSNGQHQTKVNNPSAYLYRSLSNLCTSRLRTANKMPTVPIESQAEPADTNDEDFEQEYSRISQLLDSIPYEQAEVIRLRFYGDKSFAEIASILDVPLTTAKSRFVYGIEKIRRGMRAPQHV